VSLKFDFNKHLITLTSITFIYVHLAKIKKVKKSNHGDLSGKRKKDSKLPFNHYYLGELVVLSALNGSQPFLHQFSPLFFLFLQLDGV